MDISHNIGTLIISREMLKHYTRQYDMKNPLFRDFVPVDVKYDFTTDEMQITGYSPKFEPISDGEIAPKYEANVTQTTTQQHIVTVKYVRR